MSLRLGTLDGAQRLRPTEEQWAALVADHGAESGLLPAAIAPLVAPDRAGALGPDAEPDAGPEVGHAVALLTGQAPVRVEVRSRQDGVGVLGLVATDGAVCAALVRRVDTSGDEATPVPGVELSVFGIERLVDEVLRMLPPTTATPPGPEVAGPVEVDLPLEAAVMLSRAMVDREQGLAEQVTQLAGLDEVPPLVESLASHLVGEAAVGVTAPAVSFGALRTWLVSHLGWVALELRGDHVVHRLVTTDQVRDDLVFALTGALSAGGGEGGG